MEKGNYEFHAHGTPYLMFNHSSSASGSEHDRVIKLLNLLVERLDELERGVEAIQNRLLEM